MIIQKGTFPKWKEGQIIKKHYDDFQKQIKMLKQACLRSERRDEEDKKSLR